MKHCSAIRLLALLLCWIALSPSRSTAALVDITVTDSPDPVVVGELLTYTLNLTNVSGVTLTNLVITETLSSAFTFNSATATNGTLTLTNGTLQLLVLPLTNLGTVRMIFDGRPTLLGMITNLVSVGTTNSVLLITNLLVTSTVVAGVSDFAIGVTAPTNAVFRNDQVTFSVAITNRGPSTATNVLFTARFSAGALVRSVSPSNATFTASSTNLSLGLGTLTNGAVVSLLVTLEPATSGTFSFLSQVSASDFQDPDSANDLSAVNLTIQNPLPATLGISFLVLTQQFNPQTGLMTQKVRLANAGASSIPAARVLVDGLTNRSPAGLADRLINAVGTNAGRPFVVYANTLDPGSFVDLTLEFFFPTRTPYTNLQLSAVAIPAVSSEIIGSGQTITMKHDQGMQIVLIEFPAVVGRRYAILYNDNGSLTNWNVAQPTILATASRVQWIDEGPPKTISPPASVTNRFYRVLESP